MAAPVIASFTVNGTGNHQISVTGLNAVPNFIDFMIGQKDVSRRRR